MPAPRVNRASALPLYAQLADFLRASIRAGELRPGDGLPSEAELCAAHDMSRTSVRQALTTLVDEGLVVKERGRGTFVRREPAAGLIVQEVRGFADEMQMLGQVVTTLPKSVATDALPPNLAPLLSVPMGTQGIRLERVRLVDGQPVASTVTWLASPRFDDLLDVDWSSTSLYLHLASFHSIEPVGGYRRLEAVAATTSLARDLDVATGSPLLRMTATNEDASRVPFEWFVAHYRADRIAIEMLVESEQARGQAFLHALEGTQGRP